METTWVDEKAEPMEYATVGKMAVYLVAKRDGSTVGSSDLLMDQPWVELMAELTEMQ